MDGKLLEKLEVNSTSKMNELVGGGVGDAILGWVVGKVLDAVSNDPKIIAKGGDPFSGHYIDPIKMPTNNSLPPTTSNYSSMEPNC